MDPLDGRMDSLNLDAAPSRESGEEEYIYRQGRGDIFASSLPLRLLNFLDLVFSFRKLLLDHIATASDVFGPSPRPHSKRLTRLDSTRLAIAHNAQKACQPSSKAVLPEQRQPAPAIRSCAAQIRSTGRMRTSSLQERSNCRH